MIDAMGFNPRSPCGERRRRARRGQDLWAQFQPTLPLRGATRTIFQAISRRWTFQPTLPLRGATRQ